MERDVIRLEKAPGYRWVFLALNCVGMTFFFMVLQLITCFGNQAMDSLGITYAAYGGIVTMTYLSYGLFNLVGGPLGTKIGTKKLTIFAMFFAIIAHLFWPVANSVGAFMLLRFIAGISGGLFIGWQLAATAYWFPAKERALAQGILVGFMGLGRSIDTFVVNIMLNAGMEWRMAGAVLITVGGIIVIILYAVFCKDFRDVYKGYTIVDEILPESKSVESEKMEVMAEHELKVANAPDSLKRTFMSPTFIFMGIAIMMNCVIVYTLASFLPLLLENDMGMDYSTVANVMAFTFLATLVASPIGGVLSDRVMHKRRSPAIVIAFVITIITCLMVPYVGISVLPVLLFFCYGGVPFMNGPYWALPEEIFKPQFGGTASSVLLFIGIAAGTAAQPLIGALVDYTGTNMSAMYAFVIVCIVGTLATIPIWIREKKGW